MRSFYILCFFICIGLTQACKHDTSDQKDENGAAITSDTTGHTAGTANSNGTVAENTNTNGSSSNGSATNPDPVNPKSVDTKQGHDYTFLTHNLFRINGAYVTGKDPKEQPYKGQWVDLEPNGSFKWGKGKDVLYTGIWGYNHDIQTLGLIPNDKNYKQSEWTVTFNDDMVLWVGTTAFGNNGTQLQLIRTTELPN